MTLNGRMTVTTAVACVLASTALLPAVHRHRCGSSIAAGAVITVAATGALTRLRTLPVPACLAAGVAGLLLYLNLVFEARHSLLFVIPTPGSLTRLWRPGGHRAARREQVRPAGAEPARPAAAGRRGGGHHRGAGRPDRGAAAVHRAGRAAAARPVHRPGHDERLARPVRHRPGVLPGRGGIPGHAQRRRAGTDPGLGPPGLAVAPGAAAAATPASARRARSAGEGRARTPGCWPRRAAGSGSPRSSWRCARRCSLPGLHPSKLFSSGPGIGGNGGGVGGASLSLPGALSQTVTQLHESRPSTVFTYTTSASASQQDNDAEYFRQYVFDTLGDTGWQVDDYRRPRGADQLDPRPPGPDRHHGGSDGDHDGHRQQGLPQPGLAADVPAAALSGHPGRRAGKVAGRPRPHGVLHRRLHRRPVLLGGERRRWIRARRSWKRCPGW